ncbi:MAG: radical SAM family heme chaperone HemW [Bacteroidales bacterium]|nr:radical SAM family heme chaperone HemW [Bacteroidales bacterium]MBN2820611.1 radical SAM family heme chaperone HemW [Bacteroidales bacterium]
MAGFYVHIPFCKKACNYCDFHFVASLKYKNELINAIISEIEERKTEWQHSTFDTIYFGGGTPTVLRVEEINRISDSIFKNYRIEKKIEFTIEANPDDLSISYLRQLKNETKINRLSIGIQSFNDNILSFLNRRHNGKQAIDSITNANNIGFTNITIDLIYGIPGLSEKIWAETLNTFFRLNIPHLSAYQLMLEPKTIFYIKKKRGEFSEVDEQVSLAHYEELIKKCNYNSYKHYEISNFCRQDFQSRHNSSYWKNIPYIGVGPSAHSYNGMIRRWNISNNSKYIEFIEDKSAGYFEIEELSSRDKYNDYILTSFRTIWGANLVYIKNNFEMKFYSHFIKMLEKHKSNAHILTEGEIVRLSEEGWLISDYLMSEFIYA